MSVWLIRHGQSKNNAGLPTMGNTDVPLTDLGVDQARVAANRLVRQPDILIVSPFARARATAQIMQERWPAAPSVIWQIQELTYLSPATCLGTTTETRQPLVDRYWAQCDPERVDGPGAESFVSFLERIRSFHERLQELRHEFVVVVGHGQFFRAYLLAREWGFVATREWMHRYRASETASPMANGEIIELNVSGRVQPPPGFGKANRPAG
jgi:broad specificity phosphatase PhoE